MFPESFSDPPLTCLTPPQSPPSQSRDFMQIMFVSGADSTEQGSPSTSRPAPDSIPNMDCTQIMLLFKGGFPYTACARKALHVHELCVLFMGVFGKMPRAKPSNSPRCKTKQYATVAGSTEKSHHFSIQHSQLSQMLWFLTAWTGRAYRHWVSSSLFLLQKKKYFPTARELSPPALERFTLFRREGIPQKPAAN